MAVSNGYMGDINLSGVNRKVSNSFYFINSMAAMDACICRGLPASTNIFVVHLSTGRRGGGSGPARLSNYARTWPYG